MRSVPVRKLNQQTADVLARAEHSDSALTDSAELRPAREHLPLVTVDISAAAGSAGCDAAVADRRTGC